MAQAFTFEELKHKTVGELRAIAAGMPQDSLKGHTQMNKEHLLKAICQAAGIDMHAHHDIVGVNKAEVKAQLRALKKQRDQAIEEHDHAALHVIRRRAHHLKRELHKAAV
jgi:hypothetical protein